MTGFTSDFAFFKPELAIAIGGLLMVILDLAMPDRHKSLIPLAGLAVLAAAATLTVPLLVEPERLLFFGTYSLDSFGLAFKLLALVCTGVVIAAGSDYFRVRPVLQGEVYVLLVFGALALVLLSCSADLITVYLSLEFVGIISYVLAGYLKYSRRSNEAALKYFLYGATASAVMLYGMSLLYGATGTTNLAAIAQHVSAPAAPTALELTALVLLLVGFGYKISMVPFHAWAPDVYEGAPTPITAFLSVGPKLAGFAVLVRVLAVGLEPWAGTWVLLLAGGAALTMFVGNLGALAQVNIKRMLAYSSIAHAGCILIGVSALAAGAPWALQSIILYAVAYLFMNLGAFAVAIKVGEATGTDAIADYAGLARRSPALAGAMLLFLLSLAGIPPLAGFAAKLYAFGAAIQSPGLWWLAVVGIVNSIIALFYYMNVVRLMYFAEPSGPYEPQPSPALNAVIALTAIATALTGMLPAVYQFALGAARLIS